MNLAKRLGISVAPALLITWIGTYLASPMHPLLGAPAWGFTYLFGEVLNLQPNISHHVSIDAVVALARAVNLIVWWSFAFVVLMFITRARGRRPSV